MRRTTNSWNFSRICRKSSGRRGKIAVRRAAEAFARGQSRYQLGDMVSLEAMCVGWIRTTPTAERAHLAAVFAQHHLDFAPFEEYTAPR